MIDNLSRWLDVNIIFSCGSWNYRGYEVKTLWAQTGKGLIKNLKKNNSAKTIVK